MWLALALALGCGAGTEMERIGDSVMSSGAGAPGSAGPLGGGPGMSAAGASAAVSGGVAGSAAAGSAASGPSSAGNANGANSQGASSASAGHASSGNASAGNASMGGASAGGAAPSDASMGSAASGSAGAGAGAGHGAPGNASMGGAGTGGPDNSGTAAAGSGATGAAGSAAMHAGAAGSGMSSASNAPLTVYIASDSTASNYKDTGSDKDQAGWGQMLPEFVKPNAKVDNRAIGGRTARRFIDEGRLDEIWKDIHSGDYLLVQFGTNDGNKTATYELNGQQIPYYLDPETDFKTYIKKYIEGAQQHGAVLVLVTPPPRNSAYCTGGNGTGAHAQALRELGESEKVLVVDLNQKAVDYLKAICPEPSPPNFFLQKPDGSVDGTHFQKSGARKLASFVAEGLRAGMVGWIKD